MPAIHRFWTVLQKHTGVDSSRAGEAAGATNSLFHVLLDGLCGQWEGGGTCTSQLLLWSSV